MTTFHTTGGSPQGAHGRLARLIATRGGRAAPCGIEHREALIYMLYGAAELEHRIMRHFMFLERPEGMALTDARGLAATGGALPHAWPPERVEVFRRWRTPGCRGDAPGLGLPRPLRVLRCSAGRPHDDQPIQEGPRHAVHF
jgi:hypothetical protein